MKNDQGVTLANVLYFLSALSLIGTAITALAVMDSGMPIFWGVVVSGVASALIFIALGALLEKAAHTQVLVKRMARQIEELMLEKKAASAPRVAPAGRWAMPALEDGPPPPPSGWKDRMAE